ncbi:Ant protein [Cryptosporidium felis]|nr:Ant protein [Cryptosporidium felis]
MKFLLAAISSLISAVIASLILHPFDVVKTRQQVMEVSNGAVIAHQTFISTFIYILETEGISGLYNGLNGQVVASGLSWFIFRYIFDFIRFNIESGRPLTPNYNQINNVYAQSIRKSPFTNSVATIIAGIISTALVHPFWLVKTRLEMQSIHTKEKGWRQYSWGVGGVAECIYCIFRKDGIFGLYSGFTPTLLLIPHSSIQLVMYDIFQSKFVSLKIDNVYIRSVCFFAIGFTTKLFASILTYPLQVIRSRVQMSKLENIRLEVYNIEITKLNYKEFVTFIKSHFYPGLLTHIPKVCIHSGIMFLIYESVLMTLVSILQIY